MNLNGQVKVTNIEHKLSIDAIIGGSSEDLFYSISDRQKPSEVNTVIAIEQKRKKQR